MIRRFPNLERLVTLIILQARAELADEVRAPTAYRPDGVVYHVGTDDDVPDDLQQIVPYIRITSRPSGGRDRITDSAFLDIDVFDSASDGDAEGIAESLADPLLGPIRARVAVPGAGVLDYVRVSARPVQLRWADTTVSRYLLQLQVSARRTGG